MLENFTKVPNYSFSNMLTIDPNAVKVWPLILIFRNGDLNEVWFWLPRALTSILEQYFGWNSTFEYRILSIYCVFSILCEKYLVHLLTFFSSWEAKKGFWQSFWTTVERSCGRMLHLRYRLWLRLFIPILVWTSGCFGLEGKGFPWLLILKL